MSKPLWQRVTLPVIQCDPNCGKCCGPCSCKEGEFKRIEQFIAERGITPIKQGGTCPLYQNGGCAVYEVRPFICRYFGHHERLVCCKGYNRNIEPRLARELDDSYGTPTRCLHELVGMSWKEAMEAAISES